MVEVLGSLRPARGHIDRDALMYRAGQVSARRRGRLWRAVAAVLAVCLGVSVGVQMVPEKQQQREYMAAGGTATVVEMASGREARRYLRLRDTVLAHGAEALPAGSGVTSRELTLDELLTM